MSGNRVFNVQYSKQRWTINSIVPFWAMVAFCFSMTVGVIWEFIEFICDQCFYLDMQKDFIVPNISSVTLDENNTQVPIHVTQITRTIIETEEGNTYAVNGEYLDIGIIDTMKDLMVNCVGALCLVLSAISTRHDTKQNP